MIDEKIIRENYASMMDSQLIAIAKNDGHQLTPVAFNILKQEFLNRNLDIAHIETVAEKKELIHQEQIQKVKEKVADDYTDALWKYIFEEKEKQSPEIEILAGLKERGLDDEHAIMMLHGLKEKLTKTIDAQDTKMLAGGLSFLLGLFATIWTFSNAQISGGYYIVAWGALIFGPIRFFSGLQAKNKYKKILLDMEDA